MTNESRKAENEALRNPMSSRILIRATVPMTFVVAGAIPFIALTAAGAIVRIWATVKGGSFRSTPVIAEP
jgi:hypothetical protein